MWFFISHLECCEMIFTASKHVYNAGDAFNFDVSSICNANCITSISNHLFECSCYVIVPCLNVCIPNDDPFKINHSACSAIGHSVLCNVTLGKFIIRTHFNLFAYAYACEYQRTLMLSSHIKCIQWIGSALFVFVFGCRFWFWFGPAYI